MRAFVILAAVLVAGCAGLPPPSAPADIVIQGSRVHPESITADAAGNIYVGSIGGTVYRAVAGSRTAEPWIVPSAANGLTSLFGVLADDTRSLLWVCNNPPFGAPPAPGAKSGLRAFDLGTGALSAVYDLPGKGPFACNDMAVAADGAVYATDTAGGRIFVLRPNANELELFAESGELGELVGIDGIAIAGDGKIYINNVRTGSFQRVEVTPDGRYGGVYTLDLSDTLNGPDGLRPMGGNRFLQAEGPGGRVAIITVEGDNATVTPVKTGLQSSPGVTYVGRIGYATEGKIGYLFDPALRGKDPGPFVIRAFHLP